VIGVGLDGKDDAVWTPSFLNALKMLDPLADDPLADACGCYLNPG
jgi:hypothetical protein